MTTAPVETDPPGARWSLPGWVLVVAAFAVGFANFPLRAVGPNFDHLPGDGVDNRLNNYVLEHGYRWARGQESAFWHAPMFYPARQATAFSDAHLGMLPVYAALRAVNLSPERALQGWFLIPFVLNYAACVWVVRRLGWSATAAAVTGIIFAFGLPVAAQLTHGQLLPRFLVPPALYFGWRWLASPTLGRLIACATCLVGQAYLSLYVAYFLGLLLVVGLVVTIVLQRFRLFWRVRHVPVWSFLGVALAALLALLPILIPYATAHGPKPPDIALDGFPSPASWLAPADISIHKTWSDEFDPVPPSTPAAGEKRLFPGVIPLVALGIAALTGFSRPARNDRDGIATTASVVVLSLVVLTTMVGGYVLYEPLLHLPGVSGMRVMGRVVLVLLFPAGLVVAALLDHLLCNCGRVAPFVAYFAVSLVLADQWLVSPKGPRSSDWAAARYPLATALARQERVREAIRQHPDPRLVYVFPGDRPHDVAGRLHLQLDAMRASQDFGLPTINGWSGYWPVGWDFFTGYRGLMTWLDFKHAPPDRITGLVVISEPIGDDPEYERMMRLAHPPIPLEQ